MSVISSGDGVAEPHRLDGRGGQRHLSRSGRGEADRQRPLVSGDALPIKPNLVNMPSHFTCGADVEGQHPTGVGVFVGKSIEDEVAQAVKNRFAFVDLDVLGHMGVAADHGIGAAVDHPVGQALLLGVGPFDVFPSPMRVGDDQVRAVVLACARNVLGDVIALAPGDAGLVVQGLKAARHKNVIPQDGDALAFDIEDNRFVRCTDVFAPTEIAHTLAVKLIEHALKGGKAKVHRMVVGQGHGTEVIFDEGNDSGMCQKREGLICGDALGANGSLQVANRDVSALEQMAHMFQRVAAAPNQLTHGFCQHHVAHKHHANVLLGQRT